ncbi:hypothetical protein Tco_1040767 [Tanacetum coccineum]
MAFNSTEQYMDSMDELVIQDAPREVIDVLITYTVKIYRSDEENQYSKPMLWIGMYVGLASLICILAMVADLLHGLRARKLWFPCKYFTINSASLTVIAVAMKLPVDLTSSMPGNVDQVAKLGSMAFMCSMMANLLPSLATMDSKELFTNIAALVVLVITFVVNVCIQIATGVVSYEEKIRIYAMYKPDLDPKSMGTYVYLNKITATIHVTLLLMLLIIHICSSLAILMSKQIIESKYQVQHARVLMDQQSVRSLTLEELKQHVRKYWIMGGTGSPQFITVCFATSTASGVICVLSAISHFFTVLIVRPKLQSSYCESDYKWSMSVILVTQSIGVAVGTIAPLSRWFAALSFTMSVRRIWNHLNVFETESYWIQKLKDWELTSIPIPFYSGICEVVIENMKLIILSFLIQVQKAVVITCKMISLIPYFYMMCVLYCLRCLKPINTHPLKEYEDYVLQLHQELAFQERTLNRLLNSANRLMQKAEKRQPKYLMELLDLAKSSGFEDVEKSDNDHVPNLSSKEYLDCWSLPVVTLTAIVVSLPNIQKDIADTNFFKRVSEAFKYVTLVEESLNATSDYVSIQMAAKRLWLEVRKYRKWLGHKLIDSADTEVSIILQWFSNTAKEIVTEVGSIESGTPNDDSICRSICANSMYRITEAIMLSYKPNINQVSHGDMFAQLSSVISDIVAACLTNLPQAIALKCHSEIEKREANVHAAAQLLGETTQIIKDLPKLKRPSLNNPDDFHFIHKCSDYLRQPFP